MPHFVRKSKDDCRHALKAQLIEIIDLLDPNNLFLRTKTKGHGTGANHGDDVTNRFTDDRAKSGLFLPTLFIQLDN